MFPGLPTSLHGGLVIGDVDEECQARVVTKHGQPFGAWLDDTTPNLTHWLALTIAKYEPLGQPVFVCVAPGRPHLHHEPEPPVINVYEWYVYGMGVPRSAWPRLPPKGYRAYCVQWRYPGTEGKRPPTRRQRLALMAGVMLRRPEIIFLF